MRHGTCLLCVGLLQIAWSVSCDARSAAERQDALAVRELALSSYRANYGLLQGVRCRMSQTISLNLDLLNEESEGDESFDLAEAAANGVNVISPDQVRPLRPKTTPQFTGIRSTTDDHLVLFCGDRVRNERQSAGELQAIHVRDHDNYTYQSLSLGSKRTDRRRIIDHPVVDGPIIDPRDLGAKSGIGSLARMLETWEPISARRDVKLRDVDGLIELTLQEPAVGTSTAGLVNRCSLYLDPDKNHLPLFAKYWQGATLSVVVAVEYSRCDWVPSPCYLPSHCISLMPTDSQSTEIWSERSSRSTVKYVVTEVEDWPSACDDATYHVNVKGGDYSDNITGTLVHGPNAEAILHGAVSRVADTSVAFKSLVIAMMAVLGIAAAIAFYGPRRR